jgi:hypothetical protein
MWRDLEQQIGSPSPPEDEPAIESDTVPATVAGVLRRRPERRGRRVFRSSYMI